jgi:hypothetical protein
MVGSRVSDVDAARRTWAQGRYVTQGLMGVSGNAIASYKREFFVGYTNKYFSFWIQSMKSLPRCHLNAPKRSGNSL